MEPASPLENHRLQVTWMVQSVDWQQPRKGGEVNPTKELELDENGFVEVQMYMSPEQGAALMNFYHLVPVSEILKVQQQCGNDGGHLHSGLVNAAQALLEVGFVYQNPHDQRSYETHYVEQPEGVKRPAVNLILHNGLAPQEGINKIDLALTDDEAKALLNFAHLMPQVIVKEFSEQVGESAEDVQNALQKVVSCIVDKGFQYKELE